MNSGQTFLLLALAGVVAVVAILSGQAPQAAFEIHPDQSSYDAPARITFTDTSTARGGRLIRWDWDFGDESAIRVGRDPGVHAFRVDTDEVREFVISLTVWNSRGRRDTAQRTITVRPAPKPVIRNVVSDPPLERLTNIHAPIEVILEAFAEQEGRPHIFLDEDSYVWVLTGITGSSRHEQRGRVATFILKEEGEYNLVLTVTNSGGRYETWSHKFIIRPAHRANIERLTISDQSGVYPLTTTANFTASHPNSHLVGAERLKLKYEIGWGDGTGVSAADVLPGQPVRDEHTYTRPGRYTSTFRVFSALLPGQTLVQETRTVDVKYHVHYMMPAWSSDFRQIAFVYRDDSRPAFYEIRLATLQAEEANRVWSIRGETFSETTMFKLSAADRGTNLLPSWEPGGSRVVIMSDVDGQRTSDLYAIGSRDTSSRLTRLGDATAAMPSWMPPPNQQYILFASERDHTDQHETYLLPGVDETIPGERTPSVALVGSYELYRLDTSSGGISRLTYSSYSHRWPTVRPDGSRIAFEMRNNIYTASLAAADSDVTLIIGSPYTDTFPRWNPRFDHLIAFMRFRQNRWETWIYDLSSRTESPVSVEEAVDVLYPSWSPDGRYLVCQKREPAGWRLVVYEVADLQGKLKRGAVIDITPSS